MPNVTVRYWAAAKQAAGVAEEKVSAATLGEALATVVASRAGGVTGGTARGGGAQALQSVLSRSSFLVDGEPVGKRAPEAVPLGEAAVVEVLPPFAGG
jgi:molybdopterin synthase sulfur carrier subunit